ncbi:hypothetical protein DLAC_03302 [Tieghemostelium lacteum]|uniref:Chromo domain-containing protein n=1 Tax=Tieghemostelium lacteum TaxID=361077 RepID=A0A152A258_TIELA|nr:hypothetical protein DLAC_03302 [Tieghemostelium lacteum]|eukprot:KYR00151.1 hypothetical protein DLAC_03302 [Tieghemostelium lacteum]
MVTLVDLNSVHIMQQESNNVHDESVCTLVDAKPEQKPQENSNSVEQELKKSASNHSTSSNLESSSLADSDFQSSGTCNYIIPANIEKNKDQEMTDVHIQNEQVKDDNNNNNNKEDETNPSKTIHTGITKIVPKKLETIDLFAKPKYTGPTSMSLLEKDKAPPDPLPEVLEIIDKKSDRGELLYKVSLKGETEHYWIKESLVPDKLCKSYNAKFSQFSFGNHKSKSNTSKKRKPTRQKHKDSDSEDDNSPDDQINVIPISKTSTRSTPTKQSIALSQQLQQEKEQKKKKTASFKKPKPPTIESDSDESSEDSSNEDDNKPIGITPSKSPKTNVQKRKSPKSPTTYTAHKTSPKARKEVITSDEEEEDSVEKPTKNNRTSKSAPTTPVNPYIRSVDKTLVASSRTRAPISLTYSDIMLLDFGKQKKKSSHKSL